MIGFERDGEIKLKKKRRSWLGTKFRAPHWLPWFIDHIDTISSKLVRHVYACIAVILFGVCFLCTLSRMSSARLLFFFLFFIHSFSWLFGILLFLFDFLFSHSYVCLCQSTRRLFMVIIRAIRTVWVCILW